MTATRVSPIFPYLPQCSTYLGRNRCTATATHWLIQDDGKPNPGGYVCLQHGEAIVSEFKNKLAEEWTLETISTGKE
jgi:hypothetical protein